MQHIATIHSGHLTSQVLAASPCVSGVGNPLVSLPEAAGLL